MRTENLSSHAFTEDHYWAMSDCHASKPVPLHEADLTRPFVYERRYGVFYVPCGLHPQAMSLLLAFQHGLTNAIDVAEKLKLEFSSGTADHWLEHTEGAAFMSSVGKKIQAGKMKNLSVAERRIFGDVNYIFD